MQTSEKPHVGVPSNDSSWPLTSRYYDPLNMDAHTISTLLAHDTAYRTHNDHQTPWHLVYTSVEGGQALTRTTKSNEKQSTSVFSPRVMNSRLVVMHVDQGRTWGRRSTKSAVSLDEPTWRGLLEQYDILPSFLELLHSDSGGTFSHVSFEPEQKSDARGIRGTRARQEPVVFHLGYKIGGWIGQEKAIYARLDLRTGKTFVLVMGTESCRSYEDRIYRLLHTAPNANIFQVVHGLLAEAYAVTEKIRWQIDYSAQEFEKVTCIGPHKGYAAQPLDAKELSFNRKLQVAVGFSRNNAFGSSRLRLISQAFSKHIMEYHDLSPTVAYPMAVVIDAPDLQKLQQAVLNIIELTRHQYDQIQELYFRLVAQADITRTLMAQRDTQLNIGIAESTRRDSELMRGIAAVTMIFLPATFVATFFSMIFFQAGNGDEFPLAIDRRIWWYPAVTVPLTAGIAIWYCAWSFSWVRRGMTVPLSLKKRLLVPSGCKAHSQNLDVEANKDMDSSSDVQADEVEADDGSHRTEWPYLRVIAGECSIQVDTKP